MDDFRYVRFKDELQSLIVYIVHWFTVVRFELLNFTRTIKLFSLK